MIIQIAVLVVNYDISNTIVLEIPELPLKQWDELTKTAYIFLVHIHI